MSGQQLNSRLTPYSPRSTSSRALVLPNTGVKQGSRSHGSFARHFQASSAPEVQEASAPGAKEAQVAEAQLSLPIEDPWICRTVQNTISEEASTSDRHLEALHADSIHALRGLRMPTIRNEAYRFCDVSPILRSNFQRASHSVLPDAAALDSCQLSQDGSQLRYIIVDGRLSASLSSPLQSSDGLYIGPLQGAPPEAAAELGGQSQLRGSPFALVNGATAPEPLCIAVARGVQVPQGIHLLYISTGGDPHSPTYSAPRVVLSLQQGASLTLTEEFNALQQLNGSYFANSVLEASLACNSSLSHRYVQLEQDQGWHMKGTLVRQAQGSTYSLTEAAVGGGIARHDVSVAQEGPATSTTMRAFVLAGQDQTHDLHTKLLLEHPDGVAQQLHKCIVAAASGRGVFDGNVKVERLAQRSDAAQLSRNLLLAPRATVNVKPNLQIVADDVKCSHGCTVSDLEEDQLFYLRTRGISAEAAREILVFSFGAEVTQGFKSQPLIDRIEQRVTAMLSPLLPSTGSA